MLELADKPSGSPWVFGGSFEQPGVTAIRPRGFPFRLSVTARYTSTSYWTVARRDPSKTRELFMAFRNQLGYLVLVACVQSGKLRFSPITRNKSQGDAVVAPALAGGGWAIVKHMAMVAAAADAVVFGPRQN
jgi:hypothetical protein